MSRRNGSLPDGTARRTACTVLAPAKINLFLHVVGKRPDGYHDLVTRMQALELADELDLRIGGVTGVSCRCDCGELPVDQSNLAVRAAGAFLRATGLAERFGVDITLRKRIPVAAGLGGGSSDAGAVLRALNEMLGRPLDRSALLAVATTIGADVPFFASGLSAAVATGIGERLQSVPDLNGVLVVLVNPGFGVSTRWVFENYALTTVPKKSKFHGSRIDDGVVFTSSMLHNDLESVTLERYPEVAAIKAALLSAGADGALMTGSGATVFGLFPEHLHSERSLTEVTGRIVKEYGGRAVVTRPVAGASPSGKAPGFDPGIS